MAAPARRTIELFYDVISPYSWIGFETLCRYRNKWNIDLKFRPFFLGGVMNAADNTPPGMNQAKMVYMLEDLKRMRNYHQIPISPISNPLETMITKGSLRAQRFLTAIQLKQSDEDVENVSRQLWLRLWSKDQDIYEPESLIEVAIKAGLSEEKAKELVTLIQDKEVKDTLKNRTETAIEYGAFGAPCIVTEIDGKKQMFFGSDRFHLIAHMIGEKYEGPLLEYSKL